MELSSNPKTPKSAHKAGGLAASIIHRPGSGVTATKNSQPNSGWVEGYLVSWGNSSDTDLQGEHFSPRTEFCLDWFKDRPVLYHHGLDGTAGLRKIGSIKTLEVDDLGLWVQAQLDLRDRYANAVYDMVKTKEFGWSSGSVDHLVQIADNGEIAVWPLIEGSITPTPAQPSKTSVRAFKAILSGNHENDNFLRGLKARVENGEYDRTESGLLVNKSKLYSLGSYKSEDLYEEDEPMARKSSRRLARAFARGFGIKVNDKELDAVAADVEEIVDDEVAQAAADELETEAALAALEQEMIGEEIKSMGSRSYRSTGRRNVTRRTPRRAYRTDEALMGDETEQIAAQLQDELAAQMDSLAADVADEISAQLEDELSAQADDLQTEKAMRRVLRRKAMRQFNETPADAGLAVEDNFVVVDDPAPIASLRRSRRRKAYRTDPLAVQQELESVQAEDQAVLMEEVAERAYRNGLRKGVRSGLDAANTPAVESEDELPVASYRGRTRRNAARRAVARRRAYRADEALMGDDLLAVESEDELPVASYRSKARRSAARRAVARRRAYRNTDEALMGDDLLAVESEEELPVASYRGRARRNAARRAVARRRAYRTDEALMGDETLAVESDQEEAARAFRKGYRAAMRRNRRKNGDVTEAVQQDLTSTMGDDEMSLMSDELGTAPVASYRGRRGRKSMDFNNQTQYWRDRAIKAELSENPGQRQFGNVRVTRDAADQPGAYNSAFKSYLYNGISLMSDTDKYTLMGKGKVNWGKAAFGYDGRGRIVDDPRAIKTYFGGSDASVGFAVPPDWVTELNKNIMTGTYMAPECKTRTTTSDRIVIPNLVTTDARRSHAAVVRWPGENVAAASEHTSVEDTYSQIDVPIHVMLISLTAGNSALEDVTFSLEDEINESFSEAVAVAYDQLIWGGDGQGKLEGIVTNSAVTGSRSTNMQTVSGYIPTSSPDGIVTADSLKEMYFHLPRGYRQRAKWFMNSNTGLQIATLKDGEGNYLIDQRDESLQAGGIPEKLLGKPIVYNEFADDIAEDAFPVVLGDLSRGYIIGKRVDFAIRRFDDSAYAELDQVLFLGRARLGGQVLQPAAIKVLKIAAS